MVEINELMNMTYEKKNRKHTFNVYIYINRD